VEKTCALILRGSAGGVPGECGGVPGNGGEWRGSGGGESRSQSRPDQGPNASGETAGASAVSRDATPSPVTFRAGGRDQFSRPPAGNLRLLREQPSDDSQQQQNDDNQDDQADTATAVIASPGQAIATESENQKQNNEDDQTYCSPSRRGIRVRFSLTSTCVRLLLHPEPGHPPPPIAMQPEYKLLLSLFIRFHSSLDGCNGKPAREASASRPSLAGGWVLQLPPLAFGRPSTGRNRVFPHRTARPMLPGFRRQFEGSPGGGTRLKTTGMPRFPSGFSDFQSPSFRLAGMGWAAAGDALATSTRCAPPSCRQIPKGFLSNGNRCAPSSTCPMQRMVTTALRALTWSG